MPKKIIQKTFSKIIFLIFIFTIFSTFINKQKTSAFSVDTNTCAFTSTSSTSTVVSTADLTGTLPLCFYDVNNGDRLTLFKDDDTVGNNKICFSNTKTGDNWNWANTAENTSNCTTGGAASTTFPAGSAGTPNRINFPLSFTPEEQTNGRWYKRQYFYLKDALTSEATPATYDLTLLPATIGMTSNINGNNSITTNGAQNISWGTGESGVIENPRNLKYGDTFNVSCTNTTNLWLQNVTDGYTPATASDLGATISTTGNTKSISIEYNATSSNKQFQIVCNNVGGHAAAGSNSVWTRFVTPKKFYVKYRNPDPARDIDTLFKTGGTNDTPQFANNTHSIWDGQSVLQVNNLTSIPTPTTIPTGYRFERWCNSSTFSTCTGNGDNTDTAFNFNNTTWTDGTNGNDINIYAKWSLLPCGVTTLSIDTTNGTPCQIQVIATTTGKTSWSDTGTTKNYSSWNIINNNDYPALKYGSSISISCNNTSQAGLYHELYGAGTSYFITNSDVATPYSTSTTINYNYGNSNSTYIFMCANIKGGDSVSSGNANKTLFGFTTPKRWNVKFVNTDPTENIGHDDQEDRTDFHFLRWEGQTTRSANGNVDIKPANEPTGYKFVDWYWDKNDYSRSNNWGDGTINSLFGTEVTYNAWPNGGDIVYYAKWRCDTGLGYVLSNNSCVLPPSLPCGITTLSSTSTNGTPCPISMIVNKSAAGYNYNAAGTAITGSYNDKIVPYLGPYQLKYGEQLNFSCGSTTKYGIYSANKAGFTFTTDLTSANNYFGTTYHRFDQGDSYYTNDASIRSALPYSTSALICVNINAGINANGDYNLWAGNEKKSVFIFKTPKRFTISYRNPAGSSDVNATIATSSLTGGSAQGGLVWDGEWITLPTITASGYTFNGWYWNSNFSLPATSGNYNCGDTCTNGAPITIYAKWSQETNINATTTYPGTPCFRGVTFTSTTYPNCNTLSSESPYTDGNATTTSVYTCKADGSGWSETSSSTNYNGCYKSCSTDGKKYLYGTTGFKGCPSAPQNISCDWKDNNYTDYKLATTSSGNGMCKDSSNNNASTYLISTRNSSQATNTNYHIATSTTNPTYQQLFINGSFDASKYINQNTGGYNKSLSIACPTLLNSSGYPLLKDLSCGNNPIPRFTLLDVSAKNVKAGTGINIFWSIANPNTSCNIEAKKISNGEVISSFASSSGSNLYANITGTSTILSLSQILGLKTNSSDGSKTITSNYATNTKSFFTINESTRFIGYCIWLGATTTPIIRDVYVSGGGEN